MVTPRRTRRTFNNDDPSPDPVVAILAALLKTWVATRQMRFSMCIITAIGNVSEKSFIWKDVKFNYDDREYFADFIVLHFASVNVILGMYWLSKYCVRIDCCSKTNSISSNDEGRESLDISVLRVANALKEGDSEFILLGGAVGVNKEPISDIHIVFDFMDVLLDEISNFPPEKEIEFSIE
ncbi:uncharacterized protein LOC133285398 [Gastrolobium bilobum]|uniref:uncharacterized protein LOC133285398 n=1 Tax=Gastrolobium bilobum TaxID=150636 RepID=UPI002AB21F37|nr:uncharacterized protein LOC133285398 [Gastrolobium bilobum]